MRDKLANMGPETISNTITLGRLDRILIVDIDPTITEAELLEALKEKVPEKYREIIRINGLWQTSADLAKAIATVPRGVFLTIRRIKIGFFLCRIQVKAPPPPKCYKCHGFGHFSRSCEGLDLGGTCICICMCINRTLYTIVYIYI